MVLTLWSLRPRDTQPPDLRKEYSKHRPCDARFYFKLLHIQDISWGSFTNTVSGRSYIDGLVDHFDFVDMDVFSVHELDDMMVVLGYNDGGIMFYHFMIPETDLECGLLPLGTDQEVIQLARCRIWWGKNLHDVEFREDEYSGSKESVSEGPWNECSRSEGNMTDDESKDEDFFVDLENIVDDVDVDMKEFHIHVDEDVERVQKMTKEARGSGVDFTEGEDLEVIGPESFESPIVGEDNNREKMLRDIRNAKSCLEGVVHPKAFTLGHKFKTKKNVKE
ncbi:unnamed protein product [Lactuca saligna]|uniref:PB1-like domain-containing protein n=1 Tax=Lactuca saligna TaxID=75948 RepID=A0AA35YG39_LACSI|nr:unnamed protein product [Lactuca saligna]